MCVESRIYLLHMTGPVTVTKNWSNRTTISVPCKLKVSCLHRRFGARIFQGDRQEMPVCCFHFLEDNHRRLSLSPTESLAGSQAAVSLIHVAEIPHELNSRLRMFSPAWWNTPRSFQYTFSNATWALLLNRAPFFSVYPTQRRSIPNYRTDTGRQAQMFKRRRWNYYLLGGGRCH